MDIFDREPTLIINAIKALIAVGIGFGLDVDPEQFALIIVAVTAVMAVINRGAVYSPETVREIKAKLQHQHDVSMHRHDIPDDPTPPFQPPL